MNTGVISVRYARALLKSAAQQAVKDAVYADMQSIAQSYLDVRQLRTAIDNPMLPKEKKKDILLAACGGNPSEHTKRFVTLYRQEKNVVSGRLITAVPVSEDVRTKMQQMVEKRTQANVEFETKVNPDIIGGFILEYDTYRMDVSVQSQLRTILKQLG